MWRVVRHHPVVRVLVVWALVGGLLWLDVRNLVHSFPRDESLKDFGSFLAAGRLAADGRNPYGSHPLVFEVVGQEAPNLNPPVSVLLFHLLAPVDPVMAFRAWYFISFGLYVLMIVLLCRAYPQQATPLRVLWALSLAGFWHVLELGQIYLPLWLAVTGAWLCLRRGEPRWAGVLIGVVVAVKPNFLVWPAALLLAGYGTVAVRAFATAGALSLIPLVVYGPVVYRQWLDVVPTEANQLASNASLYAVTARLGIPSAGVVAAAALLAALVIWACWCRPPVLRLSGLALVGALLASPITWAGYTPALVPVLLSRRWTPLLGGAALLFVVPTWVVFPAAETSRWWFMLVGSVYGWALLLVFAALARQALTAPPLPRGSVVHHPSRRWLHQVRALARERRDRWRWARRS